jgi:cytidine deaminase
MEELIQQSREAKESAYAPYSSYEVGAALRTADGEVYTGCNIEIANFSNTMHAEEVALARAVSEGYREFDALAFSSDTGAQPSGTSRQSLSEFCDPDLVVLVDDSSKDRVYEYHLADWYPDPSDGSEDE